MARSELPGLFCLFAVALFNHDCAFAAGGDKSVPGWLLTQKSKVCGDVTVYLTPTALKAVDLKTSTTLVSRAPDWRVLVFNTSNKTQYSCPYEKFQGYSRGGLQLQMGFKDGGIPLVKLEGSSTVAGVKANIYRSTEEYEAKSRKLFLRERLSPGAAWSVKLLTSGDWSLPAQEGAILSRLYGYEDTPDIPLDFHSKDHDLSDKESLKTMSIKSTAVAAKEFDCPQGYRDVDSLEAVRIDAGGQSAMEDMIKDLDDHLDGRARSKAKSGPTKQPK